MLNRLFVVEVIIFKITLYFVAFKVFSCLTGHGIHDSLDLKMRSCFKLWPNFCSSQSRSQVPVQVLRFRCRRVVHKF